VILTFTVKDSVCSLEPSVGEVREALRRVFNVLPRQSILGTEQSWPGTVTTAPTSLASRDWWQRIRTGVEMVEAQHLCPMLRVSGAR
jgi:hypothetical protein